MLEMPSWLPFADAADLVSLRLGGKHSSKQDSPLDLRNRDLKKYLLASWKAAVGGGVAVAVAADVV